ncbi:ParA family protein [Endozoicomonas sp. SM1973]|uniref:ParA family protein n=1 Tax=Spartinivicinus marinus TaxID=2994442 RepID=A0A853I6A3_9GAMM|nr:ParA family protein [Spartinivicinus marinus]NYZ65471.1 ParA family protein [Spartinivicinus marinus]
MRVWAVSNQKGGVGKTTTVVTLGGLLGSVNKKVLLVDLDPHASLTCYFKYDPDHLEHSVFDLFQHQGNVPENLPGQLVLETSHPNVNFLPATTAIATLERKLAGEGGYGLVLSKALAHLWEHFDFVLLDTPPQLGVLMVNALAASERLLIPVQTEFLAIKGLERMMHTLDMINHSRKKQLPYLIVPTLFDRRTHASIAALRALRANYSEQVWQSYIPVDTKFRDASEQGVTIHELDNHSRGVKAYQHLLKDLLNLQAKVISKAVS